MFATHYFEYTKTLKKLQTVTSSRDLLYRVAKDRVGEFDPGQLTEVLKPVYLATLEDLHQKIKTEVSKDTPDFTTSDDVPWHTKFAEEFDVMGVLEDAVDDFVNGRALANDEDAEEGAGEEADEEEADEAGEEEDAEDADEAEEAEEEEDAVEAEEPALRERKRKSDSKAKVARNHTGGIFVVIKPNGRTSQVDCSKFGPGKQMRNCCIHLVGGSLKNCTLTQNRRDSVRKLHSASLCEDGVHCKHHVRNWKAIGKRTKGR